MPYFLNLLPYDFEGNWLLDDRRYVPKYVVPRNAGRGDEQVIAWAEPTYDLSGNDADGNSKAVLTIVFALNDFKNWAEVPITISGSSLSAITAAEVVTSLSGNASFAGFFTAYTDKFEGSKKERVVIKQRQPALRMRYYIKPGRAETVLLFNKLAGVAEAPTYFARHTIANRFTYPDSVNMLIQLDPGTATQADIINNAVDYKGVSKGFSSSTVKTDWQLLDGKSGSYIFTKNIYTGSDLTTKIEYHAGAGVGDLGRKTTYVYSSSAVTEQCQFPYTLTSGDLITPP